MYYYGHCSLIAKFILELILIDDQRLLRAEPKAQSLASQDDGALAPQTAE